MFKDTNLARDIYGVCTSLCVYTHFTCSCELGSALIPVLWQVEQSEKLMVIAKMNEKSIVRDRIGIRLLLSMLSLELQKVDLERTRGHQLHPTTPRQDQFKLNCS